MQPEVKLLIEKPDREAKKIGKNLRNEEAVTENAENCNYKNHFKEEKRFCEEFNYTSSGTKTFIFKFSILQQGLNNAYAKYFRDFFVEICIVITSYWAEFLSSASDAIYPEQQITLKHQPKQMLSVKACNGHFFRVLKYKATAAAAKRNLTKSLRVMYEQIIKQPKDTVKVFGLALLGASLRRFSERYKNPSISNLYFKISLATLKFGNVATETGKSNLMMTIQLKVLCAAFFTVLILRRKLSIMQWASLIILVPGIAMVQLLPSKG
ncbi:unnamed protein product [Enterobius vermicularis]|uniref:UDP-galactose translocator n=1 Tax=Enterobius vermicularis TaxID=51028 RepID=A0A0N4VAF1_ENTVE|nr:unnamed protein product [Enterobius vermicularis]